MNVGFCAPDQIEAVMEFIGEYWANNHILSTSRALVDWQHYDQATDRYNFVVGSDESGAIYGILGFIPTSHFDPALRACDTVWLTSWKVRESDAPAGLGLRLHSFLERNVPHRMVGTVGNNEHAAKIYRALGYTTGTMSQYYAVNQQKESFTLCDMPANHPQASLSNSSPNVSFVRLDEESLKQCASRIDYVCPLDELPQKSPEYFVGRFLRHPFYRYDVYAVMWNDQPKGLLAVRCADAEGSRAVRVVDYYGRTEGLEFPAASWQTLMSSYDAEYVDAFCYGTLEQSFRASSMSELDPAGDVVVPNHFEPFLKQNVVINWAYKVPSGARIQVFKADADQDRPNLVTADRDALSQ